MFKDCLALMVLIFSYSVGSLADEYNFYFQKGTDKSSSSFESDSDEVDQGIKLDEDSGFDSDSQSNFDLELERDFDRAAISSVDVKESMTPASHWQFFLNTGYSPQRVFFVGDSNSKSFQFGHPLSFGFGGRLLSPQRAWSLTFSAQYEKRSLEDDSSTLSRERKVVESISPGVTIEKSMYNFSIYIGANYSLVDKSSTSVFQLSDIEGDIGYQFGVKCFISKSLSADLMFHHMKLKANKEQVNRPFNGGLSDDFQKVIIRSNALLFNLTWYPFN